MSIELLELAGLSANFRVVDIGGGASTLVDDLIDRGVRDVSVPDVSEVALAMARKRLGDRVEAVNWYVSDDLHAVLPAGGFDLWDDRAVFHFIADPTEAARYAGIFASRFSLLRKRVERHHTPAGTEQALEYALMLRS